MIDEIGLAGGGAPPLVGLRVLDLSRFVAGPFAAQILGHLGADVVKIEEPGAGDPMRHLSKHSTSLGSAHFLSSNASKRSATLDLRSADGRDALLRLVAKSDVLVENFRPGVMDRLRLAHADLLQVNPRLVVASISGFGQTGPWRDRVAYDLVAQAAGGGMSLTGRPGEAPVKMGVPIGDLGASLYLVIGLLAALRRRDRTGRGGVVDVGMFDVQLALLNYHAHSYWLSNEEPQPEGDGHPNIVPYQAFETATRPFVVAVYGDPFWPGFCRAVDVAGLQDDARFATNALRVRHKDALVELLRSVFAGKPREHWLERMMLESVPAGPLNSVGEAVELPQSFARGMVRDTTADNGDRLRVLGSPINLSECEACIAAPPTLGAHTDEVLADWGGFAMSEIDALRAAGVI